MWPLLAFFAAASQPAPSAPEALCTPDLASKAAGEISAIEVTASRASDGWTVIRGRLIALIGMGAPPPGAANAHHLIRAEFDYVCWIYAGRVKKTTLTQR